MIPKTGKPERQRRRSLGGHIATIVMLLALAVAAAAWFWTTRQPPQVAGGPGLPHGIIIVGSGAFIAALIVQIYTMTLAEVLETAWDLIVGLFALIGAILKGIWNAILGLFGWD